MTGQSCEAGVRLEPIELTSVDLNRNSDSMYCTPYIHTRSYRVHEWRGVAFRSITARVAAQGNDRRLIGCPTGRPYLNTPALFLNASPGTGCCVSILGVFGALDAFPETLKHFDVTTTNFPIRLHLVPLPPRAWVWRSIRCRASMSGIYRSSPTLVDHQARLVLVRDVTFVLPRPISRVFHTRARIFHSSLV